MGQAAAIPLHLLTEKQWSSQVADLCQRLSWKRYHTFRSDRSPAGFPDETIVRDRLVFLELKTESGRLSDQQKDWLRALHAAKAEAYIVRPRDLQLLAQVLGRRYRIETLLEAQTRVELAIA